MFRPETPVQLYKKFRPEKCVLCTECGVSHTVTVSVVANRVSTDRLVLAVWFVK